MRRFYDTIHEEEEANAARLKAWVRGGECAEERAEMTDEEAEYVTQESVKWLERSNP